MGKKAVELSDWQLERIIEGLDLLHNRLHGTSDRDAVTELMETLLASRYGEARENLARSG